VELEFLRSLQHQELLFISERDYGQDSARHLSALSTLIEEQHGMIKEDQNWYPYEVIELGSNVLEENHEREFVACTLLVILNSVHGGEPDIDLIWKFNNRAKDYDRLSTIHREIVLEAYVNAGI